MKPIHQTPPKRKSFISPTTSSKQLPRRPPTRPNPLTNIPILPLKEKLPLPKRRPQIIQPRSLLIKIRKEQPLRPLRIPRLEKLKRKNAFAADVHNAYDTNFSRRGGHGGAAGGARGAGDGSDCVAEYGVGGGEGDGEVVFGACVASTNLERGKMGHV